MGRKSAREAVKQEHAPLIRQWRIGKDARVHFGVLQAACGVEFLVGVANGVFPMCAECCAIAREVDEIAGVT